MKLTLAGHTSREIAKSLGVSHTTICKDIHRRLDAKAKDCQHTEEYREVQRQSINALKTVWFPMAMEGDGEATNKMIKLFERESKLLGLDSPVKISGPDGESLGVNVPVIQVVFSDEPELEELQVIEE